MADTLPGYEFARSAGRYRSLSTGRFVARNRIVLLLEAQVTAGERRLKELATAYHEGKLYPAVWAAQTRTEIRRMHIQYCAMGAGGFDRLSQSDYGRIGAMLRTEYGKIAGTAADVQAGTVSLPQLLNRMNGHVGSARSLFYETERDTRRAKSGYVLIQRRLIDWAADNCPDCLGYYRLGWQIAGRDSPLPLPGRNCVCGNHCRCLIIEREVSISEVELWIGTKRT